MPALLYASLACNIHFVCAVAASVDERAGSSGLYRLRVLVRASLMNMLSPCGCDECTYVRAQLGKRDYVTGRMWAHAKGPYRLILNTAARKQINWHCEHYTARGASTAVL